MRSPELLEFEAVRARIRTDDSLAHGLRSLRFTADPKLLLRLGRQFVIHPAYKGFLWPAPFPKTFADQPASGSAMYFSFARELAWAASAISAYGAELSGFVTLRMQVEQTFLTGDLDQLDHLLSLVETRYGQSLWLLDQRLNQAQQFINLPAKHRIFSQVVNDKRVSHSIKAYASWLSYRSATQVSPDEIDRLLSDFAHLRHALDYLAHLLLGRCPPVDEKLAGEMISHCDTLSAIDRYLFLLSTLQALFANNGPNTPSALFIKETLEYLSKSVNDEQLNRLSFAWGDGRTKEVDTNLLFSLDDYNRGDFNSVVTRLSSAPVPAFTVEVAAVAVQAGLLSESTCAWPPTHHERAILNEIVSDLTLISSFADGGVEARIRLQKLVLSFAGAAWSSSLALILDRQKLDDRAFPCPPSHSYHALRAQLDQPLLAFAFRDITDVERYLNAFRTKGDGSPTFAILLSLCRNQQLDASVPAQLGRRALIEALRLARHGSFSKASDILQEVVKEDDRFLSYEAAVLLVRCFVLEERLALAADLSARLFIDSRYFGVVLPIKELVDKLMPWHDAPMATTETRGRLSVAVMFDVYSRYVSSDRDAQRADAYKDVLRRSNVMRASELPGAAPQLPREELIYFLRYVCVPDVLDQSLALSSTRAVEDERAAILVALSELMADPKKPAPAALKDELREIRTRQVVRETTLRLDQSKVYVNVDAIRRNIDVTMRENWNRYRLMLLQGDSDSTHDKIMRIVRTATGEQVTLITLTNPLTERSSLFHKMVIELRDQFTFNKEFGLNSNLSTNIRHGYVLRELRGPFVGLHLITNKDSESGSYYANHHWLDRILDDSPESRQRLTELLDTFSRQIDDEIEHLNRQLLRIRTDQNPTGLFVYAISDLTLPTIEQAHRDIETYEEFMSNIFSLFWYSTDINLKRVRETLTGPIAASFAQSLAQLELGLRDEGFALTLPSLFSLITLARTDMRTAIGRVASWFTLSGNNEYQDFDLEITYQAGLQTVKTYYANVNIKSSYIANKPIILQGWSLPMFARLFFLLLDNAGMHGARQRDSLTVSAAAELFEGTLYLSIRSDLPTDTDMERLGAKVTQINAEYGQDKAVDLLGEEGGSGYPKMWKLLNFDLATEHTLHVSCDGSEFVVDILMSAKGIVP